MLSHAGLSYFTDLQGSQTSVLSTLWTFSLSYFTDLQGSQTILVTMYSIIYLVTLLIYKVLKQGAWSDFCNWDLVTLLIYKVLKQPCNTDYAAALLSYFTDLQGSQTSD